MNPINEKVDTLFSTWDKPDVPGCAVEVIRDGQILYQRAYGMADLERKVPLVTSSIFDIASTSKQFAAAAILLLAEQGVLTLQDNVHKYLPEMPDYGKKIRIHHLVHHTSGLRDYLSLMPLAGMHFENRYSLEEILALIFRQRRLNFSPGEAFLYCNSGYLLLGEIIRRVSGKPLQQIFHECIFQPLDMANTRLYDDFTEIIPGRAIGYAPKAGGGYQIEMSNQDLVGDGGILTTIEDLFHWDQNFYRNRLGKKKQNLRRQMLAPGQLNNGHQLDYAFGLELGQHNGLKTVAHSGSWAGYRSDIVRFPEQRLSVICLANLSTLDAPSLARQIADVYLADVIRVRPEDSSPPSPNEENSINSAKEKSKKIKKKVALDCMGDYYSHELDIIYRIEHKEGQLHTTIGHQTLEMPLLKSDIDQFNLEDWLFKFTRGKKGKVNGFQISSKDGQIKHIRFKKV